MEIYLTNLAIINQLKLHYNKFPGETSISCPGIKWSGLGWFGEVGVSWA